MSEPDVPADGRSRTNHGVTSKDRRSRVDDDVVLNGWVALVQRMPLVLDRAKRSKRDPLIHPHIVSDDGGRSNHNRRTVIQHDALAQPGVRMDVDAKAGMHMLRHDPWDERHPMIV